MNSHKMLSKNSIIYFAFVLFLGVATISCRRGSGCPANEQMQSMNQDPATLAASMQKHKSKKAEPKSSVLPAEKKYVPRKKKY